MPRNAAPVTRAIPTTPVKKAFLDKSLMSPPKPGPKRPPKGSLKILQRGPKVKGLDPIPVSASGKLPS